jgi:hypothetical protein
MIMNDPQIFFDLLKHNTIEAKHHIVDSIKISYEATGFLTQRQRIWLRNNWSLQNGNIEIPKEIKRILKECEGEDRQQNPDANWFMQKDVMYQKTVMKLDDVKPESVGVNIIIANLLEEISRQLITAAVALRS